MHELNGTARFGMFAGTNVEKDFVVRFHIVWNASFLIFQECPSQMLENWCYEADVLAKLSKHHETGEPLPENLRLQLVGARHAYFFTRRCWFSHMK